MLRLPKLHPGGKRTLNKSFKRLQSGGLQSGGLQSRATDFGPGRALIRGWAHELGLPVRGPTSSGHRFWTWPTTHPFFVGPRARPTLTRPSWAHEVGPPIWTPVDHSPILWLHSPVLRGPTSSGHRFGTLRTTHLSLRRIIEDP